jgi:hypothetical protein
VAQLALPQMGDSIELANLQTHVNKQTIIYSAKKND